MKRFRSEGLKYESGAQQMTLYAHLSTHFEYDRLPPITAEHRYFLTIDLGCHRGEVIYFIIYALLYKLENCEVELYMILYYTL